MQFMIRCLIGLANYPEFISENIGRSAQGCILADDMGLGKTLQSISTLWTLLSSKNIDGKPCEVIRIC